MFYKTVYNHVVIDIIQDPNWVLWAKRSGRFVLTDETTANGMVSSSGNEVYHLDSTPEFENFQDEYRTVVAMEIGEAEYQSLKSQITDKAISESGEELAISELAAQKIAEMSEVCEAYITAGFDIVLSDGIQHHFSLQISDQLKISKLNDRAVAGESFLPYHADDEPCKIYPAEDIIALNTTMEGIVEYQTTYFNSLKMYINGMTDKDEILNVQYGVEIPEGYQSDVMKVLVAQMEVINETGS